MTFAVWIVLGVIVSVIALILLYIINIEDFHNELRTADKEDLFGWSFALIFGFGLSIFIWPLTLAMAIVMGMLFAFKKKVEDK
jgi:hypothetical protein